MKTIEELNTLKEEFETLDKKLADLSEDELKAVAGGESNEVVTFMQCNCCGYSANWAGDYLGQVFDCPGINCQNKGRKGTYCGVRYRL